MTLTIGRLEMDEGPLRPFEESWSEDGREVTVSGIQHSRPDRSLAELAGVHDDLLSLPGATVPVLFDVKSHRNGYYHVASSKSQLIELGDQNILQLAWEVDLIRRGADNEVDLESRLAGPVNRLNDHALSGERWHAPAAGHTAYWVGSDTPGQVVRTGVDGPIVVYRALPAAESPRWHCTADEYALGRVRLLAPFERSGVNCFVLPSVWEINNSLLRVSANAGGLSLSAFDGLVESTPKIFALTVAGTPLGFPVAVSILHNEYERVTLRCLWDRSPSGRVFADITLRRGSRVVEVVLKVNSSATLGVVRGTNEAATAGSGFIRATSDDGDGHRYLIGSLRTFTSDLVAGGISKASVVRLDAIIGYEVDGSTAVAGDQAAQIMGQYVGTPSEVVLAVRR